MMGERTLPVATTVRFLPGTGGSGETVMDSTWTASVGRPGADGNGRTEGVERREIGPRSSVRVIFFLR